MQKTNVPFKVALGYIIVAIVLILAIGLVYRNTTAVLAINQATRDYIEKRQAADSTMSSLLKEEQTNLHRKALPQTGDQSANALAIVTLGATALGAAIVMKKRNEL